MQFNKLTVSVLFHVCRELATHELKWVQAVVPEEARGPVDCLVDLAQCMHDLGTQKALTSAQIGFLVERWDAMEGNVHTQVYLDSLYADAQTEELRGMERFADSAEATEFFDKLQKMLNDKRLANWCAATDTSFDKRSSHPLAAAQQAFAQVVRELDDAC